MTGILSGSIVLQVIPIELNAFHAIADLFSEKEVVISSVPGSDKFSLKVHDESKAWYELEGEQGDLLILNPFNDHWKVVTRTDFVKMNGAIYDEGVK